MHSEKHPTFDEIAAQTAEVYKQRHPETSLDAAVAHAERELPGWVWAVRNSSLHKGDPRPSAIVSPDGADPTAPYYDAYGDTVAETLMAAVARAKKEREEP
jgi:hypothetical protein